MQAHHVSDSFKLTSRKFTSMVSVHNRARPYTWSKLQTKGSEYTEFFNCRVVYTGYCLHMYIIKSVQNNNFLS